MSKIIAATAIGITMTFSLPALAGDSAACQASWTKMDAKNTGYVMGADAKDEMAMMKKADFKTAAEDRMTAKEYMDACVKDVFAGKK